MTKSSTSSQPQELSTGRRTHMIHSTPRPEALTPPTPQSMVSPATDATQPPETSTGESYLKIIKNIMGKFSPTGKVSEFLAQMAEEIKKEEDRPNPLPMVVSTVPNAPVGTPVTRTHRESQFELAASPIGDPTGMYEEEGKNNEDNDNEEVPEEDVMEEMEEVTREPTEERSIRQEKEVVDVNDKGSDDEETLSERAVRRSFRARRMIHME